MKPTFAICKKLKTITRRFFCFSFHSGQQFWAILLHFWQVSFRKTLLSAMLQTKAINNIFLKSTLSPESSPKLLSICTNGQRDLQKNSSKSSYIQKKLKSCGSCGPKSFLTNLLKNVLYISNQNSSFENFKVQDYSPYGYAKCRFQSILP